MEVCEQLRAIVASIRQLKQDPKDMLVGGSLNMTSSKQVLHSV